MWTASGVCYCSCFLAFVVLGMPSLIEVFPIWNFSHCFCALVQPSSFLFSGQKVGGPSVPALPAVIILLLLPVAGRVKKEWALEFSLSDRILVVVFFFGFPTISLFLDDGVLRSG
ncbi:hypothetical protein BU24DRAFT_257844 [Aaosphaeria arxii CBS 175.79]|uniref:Uncharacterized protein n=1 Tax=Aaosphaeria arxii CBS 175.79 TaxID=1450172 RepID=A0A6A5XIN0_9PLEO|nr:uncharacterized protein BU24DRAFT_257844 [Aaosphaeria arxii CBS 175.79]KAF2012716.1 hypothetical protein BU24DRAFT_257844 [Aaosphaeria arxii CBS 175.79]